MAAARSLRPRVALARPRRRRDIVTPEGVALPVDLADRGERAGAVLIDLIIIVVALVILWLALWAALSGGRFTENSGWGLAFALVASFALRSFYFTLFELRWQGRTPGKRLLRLRVIDRRGGRLRSDAVFARNLMREVELFLPISLMIAGAPGGGWGTLLALVWVFVFVLLPFFNKDRMRAGDIVGGTWVIAAPKSVLLPDVAAEPAPAYRFHPRAARCLRHLRATDVGGRAPSARPARPPSAECRRPPHPAQDRLDRGVGLGRVP